MQQETHMTRREDLRLITGQGRYTADWNLPNQLHAVFLRADRAHALRRVRSARRPPALRGRCPRPHEPLRRHLAEGRTVLVRCTAGRLFGPDALVQFAGADLQQVDADAELVLKALHRG